MTHTMEIRGGRGANSPADRDAAVSLGSWLAAALDAAPAETVVAPPGDGDGYWAGGPSAVLEDGVFYLAYRLRRPVDQGRGYANVVARSDDGVHFETVVTIPVEMFGAASLERPALIRRPDGGWRLYVSCSTPGSKHWWVEALDADTPAGLATGTRTVVLPGDAATAWKDVVVSHDGDQWLMWACEHPLDGGDDEADRMRSWWLTSSDGLSWVRRSQALVPTPGSWDQRGTRIASVLRRDGQWLALYDGRATAEENWFERTGLAIGEGPESFAAVAGPIDRGRRTLRYVSVVEVREGTRFYAEQSRPDGANELITLLA